MSVVTKPGVRDGVGADTRRPDGTLKVRGEFAYSSDLWSDRALWGTTLRSPHAVGHASARSTSPQALAVPGVFAILTHEDVPGSKTYGLEIPDQPVLAVDRVRYQGEPVAIVAADHPETARRAASLIEVDYEPTEPVTDMDLAVAAPTQPPLLHPGGNVLKHVRVVHGDVDAATTEADVVVSGDYEVGMQDQAFLGPESGLAIPGEDGGVDLLVATQWLHADRRQIAASLDLAPEKIRLTLAGVGGAFGGREDLSMQIHACLLALHTGRPVRMVYSREESFFGHVHRHPARLHYEHGATRDGQARLRPRADPARRRRVRLELDGRLHERRLHRRRAVRVPARADRRLHRLHEQPALRRDARLRRGAGLLRLRGADGQARRRARHRSRGAAPPQRHEPGLRAAHGAADRGPGAGGGAARPAGADAAAGARERARRAGPARRRGEHHPRRGRAARRRLRRRLQERRLLGRLRRLLDRPHPGLARRRRRAARRGPHGRERGRPGRHHDPGADRPHRAGHRERRAAAGRHGGRQRRIHVRLAPELVHRRRGQDDVRGGAHAAARARRDAAGRRVGGLDAPRGRAGRRRDGRRAPDRGRPARPSPSRRRASTARGAPCRWTRTGRATRTSRSPSPRTARWSTSTSSSASSASWRSPRPRTWARRSTRSPCRARSRAGSPRASGWP